MYDTIQLYMEQYDSFLTRFKKELWGKCIEQRVFDYIPQDKVEKTKEVFENNVLNYQSQILQQEGQGNIEALYPTLIQSISKDVASLKQVLRDNLSQQKQDVFEQQLDVKQKEFNTMMNKDVPPTPQFSDDKNDEPLDKDNLDELIQRQMKERESVMNLNVGNTQNTVVSSASPLSPSSIPEMNVVPPLPVHQPPPPNWAKIEDQLKLQSSILQQILQSQIAILKKIK